jgi:hypothetical protein
MRKTMLRERYFNPADDSLRSRLQALIDQKLTIVCAARPVPGDQVWEGEWCGGIHWAAGRAEQYEVIWQKLDAARILLVDNDAIVELAKIEYQRRAENPKHSAFFPGWQQSLKKYGLQRLCRVILPEAPWRDES